MAEQQQRGVMEVIDDLADLERRMEDGSLPPAMRDKANEVRHAMVTVLNSMLPVRDDGLGGMTTHPEAQIGLPLGTANSPLDMADPERVTLYLEKKFGPDMARNFREATHEAAAFKAAESPEDFSNIPVEEARRLLGIEPPGGVPVEKARELASAAKAAAGIAGPLPGEATDAARARMTAAGVKLGPR